MDLFETAGARSVSPNQSDASPQRPSLTTVNRRDWLRMATGGRESLALSGLLDLSKVKAAAQELKLANVSEFTTSCNFCSCGCGMIAAVREGKLIAMEGDPDHIVNRGSLCAGYLRTARGSHAGRTAFSDGTSNQQRCVPALARLAGTRFGIPTRACCVEWVLTSNSNKNCSGTRPFKAR
jgi:Molybdopterin oxidoreductase Fe4S4 domain